MRRCSRLGRAFLAVTTLSVPRASAQQPAASPAPASGASPCSAPEHRQFDFWVGEWEVRDAQGQLAGTNTITRVLGGCALHESWKGSGGMSGNSVNAYDAGRRQWHQTWVDDQGGLLVLDGSFADGRMVLSSGPVPSRREPGVMVTHRITWQQFADRRVRQLWEATRDGGKTWDVVFDGTYVARK
jgi:hypothetical protein